MEEDGKEDGMMDGIVGMIKNPMIKDGFHWFDREVFGEGDINEWKHTLKKLCAFLG